MMGLEIMITEGTTMLEGWLRCNIVKGMFSDELAIVYTFKQGKVASFFVPKDQVVGTVDSQGKVKVRVFRQGDTSWAVLPTGNPTVIPVDEADLISA